MSTTSDSSPDRPHDVTDGAGRRRRPRRAVRRGTESEVVSGVSADERSEGWGDRAQPGRGSRGENDDRLLGDVPPHYGRH
ncbi:MULTISPECIES: hypothetical protein [Cellulosimicrobium]|uniref:Uncharacterized protein n=1 Tax=Cellulosimicrobium funkei TaxID=264251 RepID=A0A0H2KTL8_9MICO|nr:MULTISPECIES: hypothetical protein [Cellulosimicrobium]KLN35184.1 hypothetical protein FB00_08540 [Cellulosimicrobium funkei]KZM76681.1 hypothetical protein A0J59_19900 [Cellulosimicrobium sp. I38E]